MSARGILFEEDDAHAVVARLVADGYEATLTRERLAGEDDDEGHPWAVVTDAPDVVLELLVDAHDGWLDVEPPDTAGLPPLVLPIALPRTPKRVKRPGDGG